MADDTKRSGASGSAAEETLNKARAEFEKYRERMSAYGPPGPEAPLGRGVPFFGMPFPGAYAPGPMPWLPGAGSSPYAPGPTAMPPPGPAPFAGSGPLFENVGKMLQMGVAFATSAFAGGMQLLQGFSGVPGGGHAGSCCQPAPSHYGECSCHHAGHDCCCDHYDCCCNPGVSNCECCCC